MCRRVAVMYLGIVELGEAAGLFEAPPTPTLSRCWRRFPASAGGA